MESIECVMVVCKNPMYYTRIPKMYYTRIPVPFVLPSLFVSRPPLNIIIMIYCIKHSIKLKS